MQIHTRSARSTQFDCLLEVCDGLRPVPGVRCFQTVTAQFLDSVVDLTLLLEILETFQEHLCFRPSHSAERLREAVQSIFIIGTSSNCDLHVVDCFLHIP